MPASHILPLQCYFLCHCVGTDSIILHAYTDTIFLSIPCTFHVLCYVPFCPQQVELSLNERHTIIVPQVQVNGIPGPVTQ